MALQFVNEVGYRYPKPASKHKKLYANYICTCCERHTVAMATNVNTGNTTRCEDCAKKERAAKRTKWDIESLKKEALKYSTRQEFKNSANSAYSSARKRKLLDEVCGHMICGRTMWDYDAILKEASKYDCRIDFQMGSGSAYSAARKLGCVDAVCSAMEAGKFSCDNDAVYIWQVIDDGNPTGIYKVGITSYRLGKKRISECASSAGFKYKIILIEKIADARRVESKILKMGTKVFVGKFNGSTEFVNFTEGQLREAVSIAKAERCSVVATN